MNVRLLHLLLILAAALVGGAACSQLPAAMTPSSCGGGPDRCGAMNCPAGMRCTLTSSCTPICEQEQITNH